MKTNVREFTHEELAKQLAEFQKGKRKAAKEFKRKYYADKNRSKTK